MRRIKWILTLMLITFAARAGAYNIPYEQWMGTFLEGKKIGYYSIKIDKAEYEGVRGYKISSLISNHLTVLGSDLIQIVTTTAYTDSKYAPLKEDFLMTSGGKTTEVSAVFKKQSIECTVSAGSGSSNKSIPIPSGVSLITDPLFSVSDELPKTGAEYAMHYFNPLTLTIDDLKIKIARWENVTVGGKEYKTVVLENLTPMGNMTVWQERNGDIVQIKSVIGLTMTRMSKEEALSEEDADSSADLATITSVRPDKPINDPRQVRMLDIVLSGVNDSHMVITDSRQKAVPVENKKGEVRFHIDSQRFLPGSSQKLPINNPEFKDYLVSTSYMDFDVPAVSKRSTEIVDDESNAYLACSRIRQWIFSNLRANSGIGVPRSASDVLKSKMGVCRDYAILFAALARSAHIPAKVVSGLLYTDGAFYYHAWVECYVGKWVPFDATLPTDIVDATHIKLAEGDATSMFGLAKVIGSLKAEVKDYK